VKDIYGRDVTIRAERGCQGYGSQPYAICRETRRGVRGFVATWLPTNNSARFATKREAVAFVKAHEAIAYGTGN
jgi:hypothetical protein